MTVWNNEGRNFVVTGAQGSSATNGVSDEAFRELEQSIAELVKVYEAMPETIRQGIEMGLQPLRDRLAVLTEKEAPQRPGTQQSNYRLPKSKDEWDGYDLNAHMSDGGNA